MKTKNSQSIQCVHKCKRKAKKTKCIELILSFTKKIECFHLLFMFAELELRSEGRLQLSLPPTLNRQFVFTNQSQNATFVAVGLFQA